MENKPYDSLSNEERKKVNDKIRRSEKRQQIIYWVLFIFVIMLLNTCNTGGRNAHYLN